MIRAALLKPDGTEGLTAFFCSVEEARRWTAHYLVHPSFKRYSSEIKSWPLAMTTEITLGWRDRLIRERRERALALWAVLGISVALWVAIWVPLWLLFT